MLYCSFFDFIHDISQSRLREKLRIVFHVFFSVLISFNYLKSIWVQVDCLSYQEVFLLIILTIYFVLMLLSFHEFSSDSTRVFITNFIDHDSVISTEEWKSKDSVFIIWLWWDQFAFKSQNMNVVLEYFLYINRRSLWLQTRDVLKCILFTSYSIMLWNRMMNKCSWRELSWQRYLFNSHICSIPLLGILIAINKNHISSVNVNLITNNQIRRLIKLLLFERHSWIMCQHRSLRYSHSF